MKNDKYTHLRKELPSKWKNLLKKRWFYPAVFLGVAAIVIASVLWYQVNSNPTPEDQVAHDFDDQEAIPTAKQQEVFIEPVLAKDVEVKTPFYDVNASSEQQESALVFYNNQYHQNQGIDYGLKSGESFEVVASLSGTVQKAEKDGLLGHVVEIDHGNGVTTVYQSLANVKVKEGAKVEQGDVIGDAGQNMFNKKAGTHVHFEIRKDGVAVNPQEYYGKSASAIPSQEEADDTESMSDESEGGAKQKDASRAMTNA